MSAVLFRSPWAQQPSAKTPLRPEFAESATALVVGDARDWVSGALWNYQARSGGENGLGFVITSSTTLLADSSIALPAGSQATIVYINDDRSENFIGDPRLANTVGSTSTGNFSAYLRYTADGKAYFRWGANEVEGVTAVSGAAPASYGMWVLSTGPDGMQIWRNGVLLASNSATPTRTQSTSSLLGGTGAQLPQTPLIYMAARQYSRAVNQSLSLQPFKTLFASLPRRILLGAGGTTWTVTQAESASAADAQSAIKIGVATITEAATAADSTTGVTGSVAALIETVSASDLASAVKIAVAAITEAATAAEASFTGSLFAGATSEAATAADVLTAAAVLVSQASETASAADQSTAAAILVAAISESASATSSALAGIPGTYFATISEVAAAVDLVAIFAAAATRAAIPSNGLHAATRTRTPALSAARRRST